MARRARARARPADRRAGRRRRPGARHLPRLAAAVRLARPSTGAPRGSGCSPVEVTALEAPGLKVPHIGWEPVALGAATRSSTDGIGRDAVLLRPLASRRVRRDDDDVLGTAEHGERFACAVGAPTALRRPVPPREVERRGPAAAANFVRICAAVPVELDPLPGDRHPRRPGGPPRPGRLRPRDRLRRRPLDAARRWVEQGARALHVVDLDGAREGRPGQPRRMCAGSARWSSVPVQVGGGLARAPRRRRRCWRPAPSAAILGTAALAEPALVEALGRARTASGSSSRSTPARGRVAVEGWELEAAIAAAELIADARPTRGVRASSTRRSRSTGRWRDPPSSGVREVGAVGGASRRRADLLRRDRLARAPAGAGGARAAGARRA